MSELAVTNNGSTSIARSILRFILAYKKTSLSLITVLYGIVIHLITKFTKTSTSRKEKTQVDILVSGYGCAGAVAAIQASESLMESNPNGGGKILLIDRFEGGGGCARSGGIIYLGGGTDVQKRLNIEDSVLNMFNYLKHEVRGAVSDETLWRFCATSPQTASWLRDTCEVSINIPNESAVLCPYKTSNAPDRYSLFYSGSETCYPFTNFSSPAPRGHKAMGPGLLNGIGTGNVLFNNLDAKIRKIEHFKNTIKVATFTKLVNIRFEDESTKSKVVGASILSMNEAPFLPRMLYKIASYYGSETNPFNHLDSSIQRLLSELETVYGTMQEVVINKGLILSGGGFGRNQEKIVEHAPKFANLMPIGGAGDDGYSIFELGMKQANASAKNLENVSLWKFIVPPQSFPKGVFVSPEGRRVINEDIYGARLGEEVILTCDGKGWLIIDEKIYQESMDEVLHGEMLAFQRFCALLNMMLNRVKANTIEELAQKCGMNQETLVRTITEYNKHSKQGHDPEFRKHPSKVGVLEKGPFYAINLGAGRGDNLYFSPNFTVGGLEVEEETGRVISASTRKPIENLYAAGRNASGVCSRSYVSGLSLADCVFSGRRAGMHLVTGQMFGVENMLPDSIVSTSASVVPAVVSAKVKL